MNREVHTSFIVVTGLLVILSASVSPPAAEGGGRGGVGGTRIFPLSGVSEGLCAKVGKLPKGGTPLIVEPWPAYAMGYIDYRGQWVIPPRYRRADAFSNGIARVQDTEDGPYYYIDHSGKRVSDELVKRTQVGLERVEKEHLWGFADPETGETVIETKYGEVQDFSEGLALVVDYSAALRPNGSVVFLWSWIDYTGHEVIGRYAPRVGGHSGASSFHEGLAAVAIEKGGSGVNANEYKFGFIDHRGSLVIEPRFDDVGDFHEGLAEVCIEGKWGFIDHIGQMVIPAQYARLSPFSGGFAAVRLTPEQEKAAGLPPAPSIDEWPNPPPGWWGYINSSGNFVIPPKYYIAQPFSGGTAYVENSDFQGLIDDKGNVVFDLTVDWNKPAPLE